MILAADAFKSNAELMLACQKLGYLEGHGMDVTYGKGTWWKIIEPANLVKHDLSLDGVDFRDLPHDDDTFDWVAFDPPYVCVGGRKTSGIEDFNNAYGLTDAPRNPDQLHELMVDGLVSAWRVVKPKGLVLFKAMNYVTSGAYRTQAYDALEAVVSRAFDDALFVLKDEFIHLRKPGPQPQRDKQLHARRNYSHLFILEAHK